VSHSPAKSVERFGRAVQQREQILTKFIDAEQEPIAEICLELARAFSRGATLYAYGAGPAATDAAHIAVEFMHPVIVGKRALPALAPSNDPTGASQIHRLPAAGDIAIGLTHGHDDAPVEGWLREQSQHGLLTIGFAGAPPSGATSSLGDAVDHALIVPSGDPFVVQEVQETTYHVLWELVHVFFEHPGLLEEACVTCGDVAVPAKVVAVEGRVVTVERAGRRERVAAELIDGPAIGDTLLCHAGIALQKLSQDESASQTPANSATDRPGVNGNDEPTGFLYPFLESEEADLETVLADVRASTVQKGRDVSALRATLDLDALARCADAIRARLSDGGRLITFGNGGSSTDAQDFASDAISRGFPAVALTNDVATVTAVGNDVGFDKVFARQLIALARPSDVAVAISTSGSSPNVLAALDEAHRRQMLTCAMTGYDGGRLRELEWLDYLLVVGGDYIPRLQEVHATIYHLLLDWIGDR
jgi:D-sedoheptulose 7-phosphate isomerase